MDFAQSGLPKDPLIEKAFARAWETVNADNPARAEMHRAHFDRQINQKEQELQAYRDRMDAETFESKQEELKKFREKRDTLVDQQVTREVENLFKQGILQPVRLLVEKGGEVSKELICAALLRDALRSPLDFAAAEKDYGRGITGVIAEIKHIEAYPARKDQALAEASPSAKTLLLVKVISGLQNVLIMREKGVMAVLEPGSETAFFRNARFLSGVNKELDAEFIRVFNEVGAVGPQPFKVEQDGKGGVTLKHAEKPNLPLAPRPPAGPKPPSGPGIDSLGDDQF